MYQNTYKAFEINWYSEDLVFPELKLSDCKSDDVVSICFEEKKNWQTIKPSKWDTQFIKFGNNDLRLEIPNIGSFRASNGNKIEIHRENKNVSDGDLRTFLLGSVFGAILIQRELLILHANALSKNGVGILCMGHSGDGKSTIAYNLIKQGWKLLSDDLVALNSRFEVLPGIPRIKLWDDSIREFGIDKVKLPLVRNNINKYLLMNENIKSEYSKVPLKNLFIINRNSEEAKLIPKKLITEKSVALKLILSYCYRSRFIAGLGKESMNFLKISRLINEKTIMIANVPNDVKEIKSWLFTNNLLDK